MQTSKYIPNQIANWFLCSIDRAAGDSITHLKLQKLVYYAQAWSLALFNRPLFAEDIEAWAYGPVVPTLFRRFKGMGWKALEAPPQCPSFDEETENLLKDILRIYGKYDAKYLERLTHREDPWIEARDGMPPEVASHNIIPKEKMRKFYLQVYKRANEQKKHSS